MALREFVRRTEARERTLTVLNRESGDAVERMLENLFDDQAVTVREEELSNASPSNLLLLHDEADDRVAVSTLEEVRDTILFVNSDLYITGARELPEVDTPDVLARLDELPFSVRGYPDTAKGKLLLIEISRYIEARAFRDGRGELHSGFQRLSRIHDERGTARVYDRLATETDVDVHVYGVPDREPDVDATVRGERCAELRDTWFVVYANPADPSENAALVAVTDGDNEWEGFWTYRPEPVGAIVDHLEGRYAGAYA